MGVTLYPNGVSNAAANSFEDMADFPFPDQSRWIKYFEDFFTYLAADWTVTEVGVATQALTDAEGGVLLITNAAADNNSSFSQKVGEMFSLSTAKDFWFKARFSVSDATESDVVMGLQITDTTPLAVTDGIYFIKADGAATVDLVIVKDSVATTLASVATMADATFIELAFHYNSSRGKLTVYADDAEVASTTTLDNLPDDELLTISYGVQNGEAVAKTMSVDYIAAVAER